MCSEMAGVLEDRVPNGCTQCVTEREAAGQSEEFMSGQKQIPMALGMSLFSLICSRIKGRAESIGQTLTKLWQDITLVLEGNSV